MSTSQHPIALSIERQVGDATRLLAIVMCLPLVDGLFPALVLAGALDSITGIVQVGLLVFGGSAMVAVIIAEMDEPPQRQATTVLAVGAPVMALAVVEAALAPTIEALLNLAVFERFAGVVILAVAAKTASARIGEYLPRPAIIVGLGVVASVNPAVATLVVDARPGLMLRAAAAGGVGVGFALFVALVSPWLRNAVDLDRFRFGSAVALGVFPLSVFGIIPANAPLALAVLVVTTVFAFEPGRARERDWEYEPDDINITAALANDSNSPKEAVDERIEGRDAAGYDDKRVHWQ